jgi:hypothetical protein
MALRNIARITSSTNTDFKIAGPATYAFGPVSTPFVRGPDGGYRFSVPVTNVSDDPSDSLTLYIRVKRPSRPLPDFECMDVVKIKGGCNPRETVTAVAEAPYALGQYVASEPDSIVEVSIDKETWFPSRKIK